MWIGTIPTSCGLGIEAVVWLLAVKILTIPLDAVCSGGGMATGTTALIVVLCSLGCLAVGAVVAVLIMRGRVHQQRQKEKERALESKQLKALMYALTSTSDSYFGPGSAGSMTAIRARPNDETLKGSKEFAFVVTDIEDSTALSQQDPVAFQQVRGCATLSIWLMNILIARQRCYPTYMLTMILLHLPPCLAICLSVL